MSAPEYDTPTALRPSSRTAHARDACVDVIIPVYRGLGETRACIESVLHSRVRTRAQIIVINDASPEPALAQYLRGLGGAVTVLENDANLGFVATVNRGMALHPARDVLLLNSDTVVANDWLDRLRECAWRDAGTGTVTPFSNNATICSYPRFCQDNALPDGLSVAELDALFRDTNRGASVVIPTAVGFCMYIRRDCLEQVGLFDVALFGRGYGEENEFCLRAARRGWRHLLCADTFVYHAGGVSFADTQSAQKAAAMKTLTALYPDYESLVQRFVAADPPAPYRHAVDMAQRREQPGLVGIADANGRERYDAQPREPAPASDEPRGATHPRLAARGARVPLPWKIRLKHWLQKRDG
ncbi:MAG: glycosyltransferase family 2 protein [Pseudomonadales bacterium]|nr:glycosyltransferase family 2 protein [Pseudomonadales bacterium]